MKTSFLPHAGAVVIGRNEGTRLCRSLEALAGRVAEVVYVDSDSTDSSRELAQRLGATVVHLTEGPYTPSRGRKAGFEALVAKRPDLKYVQFIDGDCVLDSQWLSKAGVFLDGNPGVAAVFGRRREERCTESFYSRLIDLEWDHPAGEAPNFGGDALVRVSAVRIAGGWSAETINAEDIDLSFRIREHGGRIVRIAEDMTVHDVRMSRFSEYWRRSVRAGYGYAEVGLRYWRGPGRMLLRRLFSSIFYSVALPVLAVVGAVYFWPLALLVLILYARVLVVVSRACLKKRATLETSVAYAVLNLVCKTGALLGSLQYFADRASGRKTPRADLVIYRREPPE